ncbi:hypothetical protein SPI_00757 [Niveomyces insectorum RCEF 264]|uniref:C6 zinc finger domain containing protein n=1 Tax=Niveomyces insectorum RCEF 264 TaxID=1081102 RepID=A0A162JGD5_9HYPO|nr:hypothetical protein SPI_00757 [Niveomyces insectorum RCEF 264]
MVNYGVSRACEAVTNYVQDEKDVIFRQWPSPPSQQHSSTCWPDAALNDTEIEARALVVFLNEFVVEPANRELSRGFLDGMRTLLDRAGPDSILAGAAKLVALACVAHRLRRPSLLRRLEEQYGFLIQNFNRSLSLEGDCVTIESLYTAVLFGLYEVMHVRGVNAILASGASHLDWGSDAQIIELGIPLLLKLTMDESRINGILRASAKHSPGQALDTIMIAFWHFLNRIALALEGTTSSVEELTQLRRDAEMLEQKFTGWGASHSDERTSPAPQTIGFVSAQAARSSGTAYCHAGPVDVYPDYYVATVWNTYRKSHIYILDVLMQIDSRLHVQAADDAPQRDKAEEIVAGLIASVPFLLASDVHEYFDRVNAGTLPVQTNRPVGGLLLLHPLYCIATSPIVSLATRKYCRRCLEWIGSDMGIGQAAVLAKSLNFTKEPSHVQPDRNTDPRLPYQVMSESNNLIWAGMLLQPI